MGNKKQLVWIGPVQAINTTTRWCNLHTRDHSLLAIFRWQAGAPLVSFCDIYFHVYVVDGPFKGFGPTRLHHSRRPTKRQRVNMVNIDTMNGSRKLIFATTPTECVCIRPFDTTHKGIDLSWSGPQTWKTDTAASLQRWGYWNGCFGPTWMACTDMILGRFGLIVVLVYRFGI